MSDAHAKGGAGSNEDADSSEDADSKPSPTASAGGPPSSPAPRERPAFAANFPGDPELDALVEAFERGDHARVRREAPRLAERASSPEVGRAAGELRARLDPDPTSLTLLAIACALFVALTGYYFTHPHEPGPSPTAPAGSAR
jgi:hypothetical protein